MDGSLSNDAVLAQHHIPWETYKTTGQISDRDYMLIKKFDKSTETAQASAMEESSAAVFEALFTVLRNVSKETTVQYTLALIDEIITITPEIAPDMHTQSPQHPGATAPNPALVLSRLLTRSDWFAQAKAAKLLSIALKTAPAVDPAIVAQFLDWLTGQLRAPSNGDESILVATGALGGLLRSRDVRTEYARNIPLLENVLKAAIRGTATTRSQVLYNTGLAIWQLSFDDAGLAAIKVSGCVEALVELLKQGNKEKVMRISLLTLSRLLEHGGQPLPAQMVEAGLPRIVRIRSLQAWADEDIPDLLEKLEDKLGNSLLELSSLELYRKEALSGMLEWAPHHFNPQFWQENANALEEKDCQIIRSLIKVAQTSQDSKVLAIACHDLGMFADYHPHGRYIVNDLGGKDPIMKLMANDDSEVQKHALLCVQRLMLSRSKLDFLSRPAGAPSAPAPAPVPA